MKNAYRDTKEEEEKKRYSFLHFFISKVLKKKDEKRKKKFDSFLPTLLQKHLHVNTIHKLLFFSSSL
jgi:hypothetical protein